MQIFFFKIIYAPHELIQAVGWFIMQNKLSFFKIIFIIIIIIIIIIIMPSLAFLFIVRFYSSKFFFFFAFDQWTDLAFPL